MRKKIIIISILLISFTSIMTGCANFRGTNNEKGYGNKKVEIQKRIDNYDDEKGYIFIEDTEKYLKEHLTEEKDLYQNELIPIYEETSLLRDTDGNFWIGRDAGFNNALENTRFDFVGSILTAYPSKAIRATDYGYYIMYDTNTGIRLYLFFRQEEHNNYKYLSGFPIIMSKKLSYSKFKTLTEGDSIDKVESIDPVTKKYKEFFDEYNDAALESHTEMGVGPLSIHLLTDGILKIEYKRSDKSYVITKITYSPDFELECFSGKLKYAINAWDYMRN